MRYTTYAQSLRDLSVIKNSSVSEAIVSFKGLSRFSKNSFEDFKSICYRAKELGLKVILEWDILVLEEDFEITSRLFESIPKELYDSVRVQDPGVLEYVLSESLKPIQFISETGNHNIEGLKAWRSYIGDRLERMILSIELNKDKLKEYRSELDCELEILVLGKILLFYSPRKLLSALLPEDEEKKFKTVVSQDYLEAIGESEESPHKGFPIIENRHGTFMFHIKELFLLDKFEALKEIKLSHIRVDLRDHDIDFLTKITQLDSSSNFSNLKSSFSCDFIRGYFQINKSDVLFKKLKNYRIQRKDNQYIGEVLEATKAAGHIAIQIKSDASISLNDEIMYITPEGKELFCKVHNLLDTKLSNVKEVTKGNLALVNYMSGVWVKSQVYLSKNAQGESSLRN